MDILPQQVIRIIQDITLDNKLSSWRVFCGEKVVISLHYKPVTIESQGGCMPSISSVQQCAFRQKPPSAIERDRLRQDKWKSGVCMGQQPDSGVNVSNNCGLSLGNSIFSSTPLQPVNNTSDSANQHMSNTFMSNQTPQVPAQIDSSNNNGDMHAHTATQIPQLNISTQTEIKENLQVNIPTQTDIKDVTSKTTQSDGQGFISVKVQTKKTSCKDKCHQSYIVGCKEQTSQTSLNVANVACMTDGQCKDHCDKHSQSDSFMENRHCQTSAPVCKSKGVLALETYNKVTQVRSRDIRSAYHVPVASKLDELPAPSFANEPSTQDVLQQLQSMNAILDEKLPALYQNVGELKQSFQNIRSSKNDAVT